MTRDDQQKVSSNNAELFDEIRKYLKINEVQRVQSPELAFSRIFLIYAVRKLSRLVSVKQFSCRRYAAKITSQHLRAVKTLEEFSY